MSRAELAAQVRALRAEGLLQREVQERLGISRSYVSELEVDPEGIQSRMRKESYAGTCEACGGPTTGGDGPNKVPRFCWHCAPNNMFRKWTAETVTAAIREWASRRGRPPTSTMWITRTVDPDGYVFPPRSAVYNDNGGTHHPPFDSWADAVEAAGFPRPLRGHKTKGKPPMSPTELKITRTYIVFRFADDNGQLEIVGEVEASTNQEAIEEIAKGAGRFASVPKGSLQTYTLASRLVASREKVDALPVAE